LLRRLRRRRPKLGGPLEDPTIRGPLEDPTIRGPLWDPTIRGPLWDPTITIDPQPPGKFPGSSPAR
jgi:hypothetical protein